MTAPNSNIPCSTQQVAQILSASATLMESFFQSDLALQDAIADLTKNAGASADMASLQHADLLTQTHADLAKLMGALSAVLEGIDIRPADLRNTLTLRSLENALFDPGVPTDQTASGELSLF